MQDNNNQQELQKGTNSISQAEDVTATNSTSQDVTQFEQLTEILKNNDLSIFKMALKTLFTVGYNNFCEDAILEYKNMLSSKSMSFISNEDQLLILDKAIELSKFDFWLLMKFAKKLKLWG